MFDVRREIPVTQARADLAELVNRVAYSGERVVLTRHGRPVAALVSAEDLELLDRLAEQRLDLTSAGTVLPGERGPEVAPDPLRIAAEYRPAGPPAPSGNREGPGRRPGFRA